MKYVCLGNFVTMAVNEKGFKLRSSEGEITRFDCKGNLIDLRYFFKMGEDERKLVKDWRENLKREGSDSSKKFLRRVDEALRNISYDYYIATIEPSMKARKLYYEPGNEVATGLTAEQWETKAKNYAPDLGSRLALVDELILWYAYRIAKGYWSLRYVCDDSSVHGNYANSPKNSNYYNTYNSIDLIGIEKVGGFKDGVGNTYKIVKNHSGAFWRFGGYFQDSGWRRPIAYGEPIRATNVRGGASGVVVLTKVD